jgi:molecular chaperone HscB
MNYFELFNLPVAIKIDQSLLTKKYFELQKKYHPDFFTQQSIDEQNDALEKSSQINKALKVLKNEDATIKYILQQKNILQEDEKYQLTPDFLMEMMELNEDLSPASATHINNLQQQLYAEVKTIIETYNNDTIETSDLLKIKDYYYKKKYLQRILERITG